MIYLDSSALLKLLFEEAESLALERWLYEQAGSTPPVSSELARVEVLRAVRRLDPGVVATARRLLDQIDLIPLTTDLVAAAAEVGEPMLRSLDAIHLAGALALGSALSWFVAYDHRLIAAPCDARLTVGQPGAA